ncbi:MAG: preprotein translocase subunit SecY, partial [Chloroflexi bacterium]|nr:preprotein translocase subunit SecY [Chloroflexota bacterium]
YGENLRKQGAEIQNVKPGAPTQRYLTRVQRRITLPGAVFLGLVAVLPYVLGAFLPKSVSAGLFLISSAGLLIVVGVVRDTFSIIDAELKLHGYEERLVKG